jgi:serine/threonine protein kinase
MVPEPPLVATLSLSELCVDANPFTADELGAVLFGVLAELAAVHSAKREDGVFPKRRTGIGNITLASVCISVRDRDVVAVQILPCNLALEGCTACMAPKDRMLAESTAENDIWSIGILSLQLLLGRQCAFANHGGHCEGLVERSTGELPVMPRGIPFECIDFLMDCLHPEPTNRPSASQLLEHPFIRKGARIASGAWHGHACCDSIEEVESELDDLIPVMHQLLISEDIKQRSPPCRPASVPILVAPLLFR